MRSTDEHDHQTPLEEPFGIRPQTYRYMANELSSVTTSFLPATPSLISYHDPLPVAICADFDR